MIHICIMMWLQWPQAKGSQLQRHPPLVTGLSFPFPLVILSTHARSPHALKLHVTMLFLYQSRSKMIKARLYTPVHGMARNATCANILKTECD